MTLPPGRYAFWKNSARVTLVPVDLRETMLDVTAQEIMTADKVTRAKSGPGGPGGAAIPESVQPTPPDVHTGDRRGGETAFFGGRNHNCLCNC